MLFEGLTKKPPSLVDLCVRKAIDNVKYIGYVGGVDFHLLEKILQHCTLEQLIHIEISTQDTDLSPVTNKFWNGFFEKQFREEEAMEELECIEANLIAVQEKEKEAVDRLNQRYKIENAWKQSRQTKVFAKAPLRSILSGNNASSYSLENVKSNIMKKAKLDLLKSQKVKNRTAIKRNTIQKSFSTSAPKRPGLSANAPSTSRSISCGGRDLTASKRNTIQKSLSISAPKRTGLSANAPSTSRSIPFARQNYLPRGSTTFLELLHQLQKMQPPF